MPKFCLENKIKILKEINFGDLLAHLVYEFDNCLEYSTKLQK